MVWNPVHDLDTPALLVDVEKLERNIHRMQETVSKAGCSLRPHIKTHKCLNIARRQIEAGARGITCAKVSEAEIMSAVADDIFIAFPLIGIPKLERLVELSEKVQVRVSVESNDGAILLNDWFRRCGRVLKVLVKVETGLQRTGVELGDLEKFLTRLIDLKNLDVVGLFTHEGCAYRLPNRQEISKLLDGIADEMAKMREVFLRVVGREPILSPGCTLTAPLIRPEHGFSETRPGTYVFSDVYCSASGVFEETDCALTVLVQVVAVKSDGRVVVDGGSKTFAMDRHPKWGHGKAVGHPDLHFDRLSEEHGVFLTEFPERYQIGELLEVIPAHVCPVVNLHSNLYLRRGEEVLDRWKIDARGCVF